MWWREFSSIISLFLDMTFAHEGSETLTNDQLVNFTKMV